MPRKHRTRICQWCFVRFWCKDHRAWHCSRSCAQTHVKNMGPKDYRLSAVRLPRPKNRPALRDPAYVAWFWSQVVKTDDCWLWTGTKDRHGYGLAPSRDGVQQAYKQAWMLAKGEVPIGDYGQRALSIRHQCRRKECVNPDHLRLGTHAENMGDRVRWKQTLIADALGWKDR